MIGELIPTSKLISELRPSVPCFPFHPVSRRTFNFRVARRSTTRESTPLRSVLSTSPEHNGLPGPIAFLQPRRHPLTPLSHGPPLDTAFCQPQLRCITTLGTLHELVLDTTPRPSEKQRQTGRKNGIRGDIPIPEETMGSEEPRPAM